jgi:GNAT superfamily N-acetyltransferase
MIGTKKTWEPFRKLATKIREVGPLYTLRLVVRRLVPSFIFDGAVLVVTDCDIAALAAEDDPDAPIRWATRDEVGELDALGFRSDEARKLFAKGHRVLVYEQEGAFLACAWYATGPYKMLDWFRFELLPKEIFGFGAYTRPDQRGKRVISRLWKRAAADAHKQACKRYLGTVDVLNRNSLRAASVAPGVNIICRIWYLRLLGFTVVRANDKISFGWWTSKRPYVLKTEALT